MGLKLHKDLHRRSLHNTAAWSVYPSHPSLGFWGLGCRKCATTATERCSVLFISPLDSRSLCFLVSQMRWMILLAPSLRGCTDHVKMLPAACLLKAACCVAYNHRGIAHSLRDRSSLTTRSSSIFDSPEGSTSKTLMDRRKLSWIR